MALNIHRALSPRVAVLSSPDVDQIIGINGIPDFPSLLRPFESSVERLSVRTSQLETRLCERFPLRFDNFSLLQSPQDHHVPSIANSPEEILEIVSANISANAKRWSAEIDSETISADPPVPASTLSIEKRTPWFTEFRDLVLRQRSISRHETFGHPVAVLLAVSSASPDPMNDFARLYELASSNKSFEAHPYMDPNILRYYVLLHDVRTSGSDLAQSLELLDHVKKTYGLHCCLLPINSTTEEPPAPVDISKLWEPYKAQFELPADKDISSLGSYLDEEDIKRLKGFVRELTAQSIVPFMERCVQQWNERLANSRKGLTGRLFGASRKLFGATKAVVQSSSHLGYNAQHNLYPHASLEAQTRRLADFAFTIRDYKLAAAMYDLGRKDFAADKAWRYSAAATEMFGLSHLMIMYTSRTPPIDVDSYLWQACQEYSLKPNTESSALRATLLYYEAYRALSYLKPAPAALARMAGASEEVLGALLLEQAALADLYQSRPALRKHAIYLIMAGHRYQSCGQKLLSLRCYAQAAAMYKGKSWTLIENHIERELGTQAYNDGDSEGAVSHLVSLLQPGQYSADEHEAFLRDALNAYKYAGSEDTEKPILKLERPVFDPAKARIVVQGDGSSDDVRYQETNVDWESLEADFLQRGFGDRVGQDGVGLKRKRPATLATSQKNEVSIGNTWWLEAVAQNPLNTSVSIQDIRARIAKDDEKPATVTDLQEPPATEAEVDSIDSVILGPGESRVLLIPIKVAAEGSFQVTDISFTFAEHLPLVESLQKRGKRLTSTKEHRLNPTYAPDASLRISVHAPKPTLSVNILSPPTALLVGEEREVGVTLTNHGLAAVTDTRALCNRRDAAVFLVGKYSQRVNSGSISFANGLEDDSPQDLDGPGDVLQPGEERHLTLLLRGARPGTERLAWLFVFADEAGHSYTARLAHTVQVESVVEVSVRSSPSTRIEQAYDLSVEATSLAASDEVTITGVSIVSPHWRQTGTSEKSRLLPTVLQPSQVCRLQSTVEKVPNVSQGSDTVSDMRFTVERLRALLQNREINAKVGPQPTTLQLSHSQASPSLSFSYLLREARLSWKRQSLAQSFGTLTEHERQSVFTLFEPQDVDVVVHWQLASSQRQGQIHVFGLRLGPIRNELLALTDADGSSSAIRSMYSQTAKEKASMLKNLLSSRLALDELPVVVDVKVTDSLIGSQHDFVTKGPLQAPVEFHVKNMSDSLEAHVEIQLGAVMYEGAEAVKWVGRQTLRSKLEPETSSMLKAKIRVDGPGRTQVGHYTLKCICYDVQGDKNGNGRVLSEFTEIRTANRSLSVVSCSSID